MSRGHGRIQEDCWRILLRFDQEGRNADLYDIASEIFCGVMEISESQRISVQRALRKLEEEGFILAIRRQGQQRRIWATATGTRIYLNKLEEDLRLMQGIARLTGSTKAVTKLYAEYLALIDKANAHFALTPLDD